MDLLVSHRLGVVMGKGGGGTFPIMTSFRDVNPLVCHVTTTFIIYKLSKSLGDSMAVIPFMNIMIHAEEIINKQCRERQIYHNHWFGCQDHFGNHAIVETHMP